MGVVHYCRLIKKRNFLILLLMFMPQPKNKIITKKASYTITLNIPLLSLLFISAALIGKYFIRSKFSFLVVIGWILMVTGFFICLFMVFSCFYYLHKIGTGKCYFCNKELENRGRKTIDFMLTPPWKKRKVKFICRKCEINHR